MLIVKIAGYIGFIAVLLLFFIQFFVAIKPNLFVKFGQIVSFWISTYILTLFIIRLLDIFNLVNPDGLRVVSGFATVIPLIGLAFQFLTGY